MDTYLVWLIILLVLGVVISNLMVLKYTSKFKWPGQNKDADEHKKTPAGKPDDVDTESQDDKNNS